MGLRIEGGLVLVGDGLVEVAVDVAVDVAGGVIAAVDGAGGGGARFGSVLDARGLWVLPGIVDLHGDAFERQVQPRPGVGFEAGLALRDTEAQLLANGITTAFHAVTLSWEPGLRSAEAWRGMVGAMASRAWACDMRLHMRWELHNLDALEMALGDVAAGRVGMVTFNDHTPSILRKLDTGAGAAKYAGRAGMDVAAFRGLAERAMGHSGGVAAGAGRLAAAAGAAGIPVGSHDDDTVATRRYYRGLGAGICEFPMAEDVALEARAAGEAVVMGCPNVVRGGSHLGWASAAAMSERGACSVLVSDYYYPSMVAAALALGRGALGVAGAWALVSANPAAAAGLEDRGRIAAGLRGDLVVVEPESGAVVATVAGGEVAFMGAAGWGRLRA